MFNPISANGVIYIIIYYMTLRNENIYCTSHPQLCGGVCGLLLSCLDAEMLKIIPVFWVDNIQD